jgi:hypothetical protein
MNAPVDVLLALDRAASNANSERERGEAFAARDAVRELIEAAKAQRDSVTLAQEKEATARLHAALAKVIA